MMTVFEFLIESRWIEQRRPHNADAVAFVPPALGSRPVPYSYFRVVLYGFRKFRNFLYMGVYLSQLRVLRKIRRFLKVVGSYFHIRPPNFRFYRRQQ